MKYVLVLVLGLILGAVAYHQVGVTRTAVPAVPREATTPVVSAPVVPEAIQPAEVSPLATAVATSAVDIATAAPTATPAIAAAGDPATANGPGLLVPVQGKTVTDLTDTFTDARSQGRSHDAIDIMAAAGTPVLAVADGQVEKLFDSERGGLTVYQFEPSGKYAYYYAHLQRYAEGLAEKQPIKRGQLLGYVGSTGNASPDAPHLHFAIFELGPERRWWEGTAINPYPLLSGKASLAQ